MSEKKRRAMNLQVIVEPIKAKEKRTAGGIIIPETASKRGMMESGIVFMADPDAKVEQGEKVYFRPNAGLEIELEDKRYLILKATELGVAEREG